MVAAQQGAQDQYAAIAGPGGEISKVAAELADLNNTIAKSFTNGDMPNDLMDRRDVLLDQLSGYGQVSVEQPRQRLHQRLLRRPRHRRHLPDRLRRRRPTGPARRPATGTRAASSAAC